MKKFKVAITGNQGFIGKNLEVMFKKYDHDVINLESSKMAKKMKKVRRTGEVCIYRNGKDSWKRLLDSENINVLIHNAAVVGTDVVGIHPKVSTLTNILGTRIVSQAAESLNIPVIYMGTTVIFDPEESNFGKMITENSRILPKTFYGVQKLAGENIVREECSRWLVLRPLFCYGGSGDMNSLVAKSIYASLKKTSVDVFLDPNKRKDYMHVQDFCDAVVKACQTECWGCSLNVSANSPLSATQMIDMIEEHTQQDVKKYIVWHPKTDYLGDHLVSSELFKEIVKNWDPTISHEGGIKASYYSIKESLRENDLYDPLKHLKKASRDDIDLTKFFGKGISCWSQNAGMD